MNFWEGFWQHGWKVLAILVIAGVIWKDDVKWGELIWGGKQIAKEVRTK